MAECFIFYSESAFLLFILQYWLDLSHSDILQFYLWLQIPGCLVKQPGAIFTIKS